MPALDFLKNRSERVIVDSEWSEEAAVTSGMPQGGVLGPILFLTKAVAYKTLV